MTRSSITLKAARWSAEHPWRAVLLWITFVAAAVADLGHQLAAAADRAQPVLEAHHPGGDQGGVLAEAVPGRRVGTKTPRLQQAPRDDTYGEDRWLRVLGTRERVFRSLEAKAGKRQPQHRLRALEQLPGGAARFIELMPHPDLLRPLAGEDPGGPRRRDGGFAHRGASAGSWADAPDPLSAPAAWRVHRSAPAPQVRPPPIPITTT